MKIGQDACLICSVIPLIFLATSAASRASMDRETQSCEYLAVVVDTSIADETAGGHEIAEPMRRKFLEVAAEALSGLGLRVSEDREDAYWILTASGLVGPRSVGVFIELTGSIELQHHLYIAELGGDGFPYRGETGGNHYIEIFAGTEPEHYRSEVEKAVRLLWGFESEQLAALCAIAAKLRQEGWTGIKELRLELIEEMKRTRRERAQPEQKKRLELEVENPAPPPGGP